MLCEMIMIFTSLLQAYYVMNLGDVCPSTYLITYLPMRGNEFLYFAKYFFSRSSMIVLSIIGLGYRNKKLKEQLNFRK